MKALTYTTVRSNLAKTMKNVCDNHDPVIITSKKHDTVVMMSLEDYEALNETAYLLNSPRNTKRLFEAIEELEKGKGKVRKLVELK
jgi:antitoxin YefM